MAHRTTNRMVWILGGLILLLGIPQTGQTTAIWAPSPLAQLIEEGLDQNKEIQSQEARVASLKEKISFAGSLDDPRLGMAVLNLPTDTFRFDQEPMTQKQLFIAQKVPWFGKLSLRSQRATLTAVGQQAILEAKRLEIARKIATTYYDLGFIATSLEVNQRLTEIVSQMLKVAETRYSTGRGLQQDVLQAQVELSKLIDEKIGLQKTRRTLEDRLNELLNRESFIPVPAPRNLQFLNLQLDVASLQAQALQNNPWLQVRQTEVDRADVDIELAQKDYWPDMDFKVAYGQRDEDLNGRDLPDFVSASVVVNVPLWYKRRQNKNLEAARKGRESAHKFYRNLVETLPHQVDALATEVRDTQKNYRLYADALTIQAEQWAEASLVAYEVGEVEFNTMISAQIRLLQFQLQTDRYLYSIYQKRAELEELLGGPL